MSEQKNKYPPRIGDIGQLWELVVEKDVYPGLLAAEAHYQGDYNDVYLLRRVMICHGYEKVSRPVCKNVN